VKRSRLRWLFRAAPLFVASLLVALLCCASEARAEEAVRVEFPAGAYVRPGRPIVVRVAGGARRVRSSDGPWALPQGERGDEFVLQSEPSHDGRIELEVDVGVGLQHVGLRLTRLDGPGPFCATFGPARPGCVPVPHDGLPTVREAWLPFDAVDDPPTGAAPAVRAAIASFRALGPDGSGRPPWFDPLTFAPGLDALRAMAEVERTAPRLPRSAAVAAALSGCAALLILGLVRRRAPLARLAWSAAPVLTFFTFVASGAPLPGDARATAAEFVHHGVALVLVRVAAVRDADVAIALPPRATSAALLRYAAEDPTSSGVETGRIVRFALTAGEHRVFAYAVPVAEDAGHQSWLVRPACALAVNGHFCSVLISDVNLDPWRDTCRMATQSG
jgi:hypothetical protein